LHCFFLFLLCRDWLSGLSNFVLFNLRSLFESIHLITSMMQYFKESSIFHYHFIFYLCWDWLPGLSIFGFFWTWGNSLNLYVGFSLGWSISSNLGYCTASSYQLAWPSPSCQTQQILAAFTSLAKSLSQLKQGYSCIHLSVCLSVCLSRKR
jgi:hypothetical protein